jgi:hypothetical protein
MGTPSTLPQARELLCAAKLDVGPSATRESQLEIEHVVGHEGALLGGNAADDFAIGDCLQIRPVALDRLHVEVPPTP